MRKSALFVSFFFVVFWLYSVPTSADNLPLPTPSAPSAQSSSVTVRLFLPMAQKNDPPTPGGAVTCNFTIGTGVSTADGFGNYSGVKPGNTVCIQAGNRSGLKLINFKGSASAPIRFINSGGKVVISGASTGIQLYGSQYIRLTGSGVASLPYGIEITNASNAAVETNHVGSSGKLDGTEYVEFDRLYAHHVGAGFRTAKNNDLLDTGIVWSGRQFYIHDNYIQNTTNEAMYIGTSDTHGSFPIYDVQVYNNRIEDAGYDAIQIRQAHTKVLVYNNYINGTGRAPCKNGSIDNSAAFNIAKGTDTGDWYNNTVIGARTAFYIKESANVRVYNNMIVDSGHATSGLSGPECPAGVTSTPPEGAVQVISANNIQFQSNTVVNSKVNAAYGISLKGSTGTLRDNLIGGTIATLIEGTGMTLTNNRTNKDLSVFQFVNPSASDYRLRASSPLINTASQSTMPTVDIDGISRPQGIKSDPGAHEYR